MKIAIVGTGIAGNVAAYHLHREHDITVFEAGSHVGGHTHTHRVELGGRAFAVDTGFIVFNDWTYPNFIGLLDELGVESQPSSMSFSVRDEASGVEYNGTSVDTLFAQRRNLVRPSFWRMIRDILRFNREAPALLATDYDSTSLGDYLAANRYSREFVDHYVIPMGSAIWSTDAGRMQVFPARYFVRFFHNHGMLSVGDRPQWRVVRGGSARYVEKLTAGFRDRIRLDTPVERIERRSGQPWVTARGAAPERFDAVFLACHSDQALALLGDPTRNEREVLGAIPYQENEAVLHTDARLMPRRRRAWAAWNYHVLDGARDRVALTYNMNILQNLDASPPLLVTLNRTAAITPECIIKRITYHHPLYTPAGVAAQARQRDLNGTLNTYYCGAYWRFGFHEDGMVSALSALGHFKERSHAQRDLYRAA
ncbi:MAG: FAD-dependent oxidoreductase [Betaproteobacteria bacterium]|nr:FAD-dependent oxidoreductase [Betaproteobacteria bacterium]